MKKIYLLVLLFISLFVRAQVPTGNSTEVGVTQGQLSVSLTGGANYNIPIAVPPGINGIEPQISLAYNSQGGNGLAGYGWNISGVSTISRIPSTKYHDGTIDAVDFDNLDRFALDGQRLIAKQGMTYGANGTVYETENFSNLKITSYGISPFGVNFGPESFVVEYPDGSKAFYGITSDSRSQTDWAVTYWENAQGVRMSYEYLNSNNRLAINKIKYGSLGSITPINEIQFVYKSRQRSEKLYAGGLSFILNNILSEIKVLGNGIGFRNYVLGHNVTSLGYERLINITEKSGDNTKSFNPTVFEYSDSVEGISFDSAGTTTISVNNINFTNTASVPGDFNGDGEMDFILYPTEASLRNKYWIFDNIERGSYNQGIEQAIGTFEEMFPISWLSGDSNYGFKFSVSQGWSVVKTNLSTGLTTFDCYSRGTANSVYPQYSREYQFSKWISGYFTNNCGKSTESKTEPPTNPEWVSIEKNIPKAYLNGDFNGDGLSDVVIIEKPISYNYTTCGVTHTNTFNGGRTFFLDLDKRLSNNFINEAGFITNSTNSKIYVADFNGDGKSDVMVFDSGKVTVYTLNDEKQIVILLNTYFDGNISVDNPILLGDYNGDGKTDFIIPNGYGNSYSKFTSTGNSIVKVIESYDIPYNENYGNDCPGVFHIIPNDYDHDGKTDLLLVKNIGCYSIEKGNLSIRVFKNTGTNFVSNMYAEIEDSPNVDKFALPVFLNFDKANPNQEISFITKNKIYNFTSQKSNIKDQLLKSITVGNGIKESITYSSLISPDPGAYEYVYDNSSSTENYPNVDIVTAPTFHVVSKIEQSSQTAYKKKDFKYYGAVSNFEGLGFLGFRSTANTNWYNDNFQIISNVSKFDISKKGAVIEDYVLFGDYHPSSNLSPSSFISKSVLVHDYNLSSNKVYKISNTSSIIINGLEGTSKTTTTIFDNYNNPLSSTVYTKLGTRIKKTDKTLIEYFNDLGSPYIIGRPIKKNTESTGIDISTQMNAEEIYEYTNGLLTRFKKKGHNTDYITEDNEYDAFGNILKKTISAVGLQPRVTSYQYDASGRFLTKAFDIESFATDYEYDFSTGLLKKETKPGNRITNYSYDVWGKKKEVKNYLDKKTIIDYNVAPFGYSYIITTGEDGSHKKSEYDDLGRVVKETVKNIDESYRAVNTQYDIYDRKISVSEPYDGVLGNPASFTTSSFDGYGRLVQTVEHTGKTTNISYDGLITTVSDAIKTEVIEKDAIGNVIAKTDNGGTITYQYYVNGNLKQSDYNGTTISIEQDGWGRKKKLTDPSAGVYEYEYNILGELKKEISPNGTTEYFLNRYGKPEYKSIRGINTNYDVTYYYNPSNGLLMTEDGTDANLGFPFTMEYVYDGYNRLINKYESNMYSFFEIDYEYDSFGRILKENYIAQNLEGGQSSTKKIRNTYKNGYHWQLVDDVTNQVLWQTNAVNSRGQLTGTSYGNGITATNSYDQYGFPTQFKHDKTGTPSVNIMTLNTVFEPQTGNLTTRSNTLFNLNETFSYDNLDRLVKWSAPPVVTENDTFTSGVEGFLAIAPSTVSNLSEQLKVAATGIAGTKKTIASQALAGEKLSVSLYLGLGNTPNVRVDIIETNSVTGATQFFNKLMLNRNGTRSFEHTVSQNSSIEIQIVETFVDVEDTTASYFYLDNIVVTKYPLEKQDYDDSGRITANNLGTYNYNKTNSVTGLPILYQNSSIIPTPDALTYYNARPLQTVTYNVFKAPVKIEQPGIDVINFIYNATNGRSSMFYGGLQSDMFARPLRKHYSADGLMEIKHNTQTGNVEFITYIGGDGYSAPVVLKSNGTTQEYLYLHRDYQGSIVAITNQAGSIVEKRHFDAWGSVVNVQDGAGNNLTGLTVLDRGYTGHEHLQSVGLIHMNGRLYDPKLHRFLQPDNHVQDPFNTQNFNRYGYVMNNPTKFTDPSGEFWHIVIGAVIGGVVNWAVHGCQFNVEGLKAFGIGAAAGALGAATGGGAFLAAGGAAGGVGGALAGAFGGMMGASVSSMALSWGNNIAFGDPLMSNKQFFQGLIIGGVTGGLLNGVSALFNGRSFWTGTAPRMAIQPVTVQSVGIVKGEPLQPKVESPMPEVSSPQAIKEASKPQVFTKMVGADGKSSWVDKNFVDKSKELLFFQTAKDGNLELYTTKIGDEVIEFGGDFIRQDGVLTIQNFDIDGNITNELGIRGVKEVMTQFGKQMNVQQVIIEGAKRTTGANPGRLPAQLIFNIK